MSITSNLAFLKEWELHGFPGSDITTEFKFHPDRDWRFDIAFPSRKVGIDIDGRAKEGKFGRHQTVTGVRNDCEKFNTATEMGWAVLRLPTSDLAAKNQWGERFIELFIELLCRILSKREIYVEQSRVRSEVEKVSTVPPLQGSTTPRSNTRANTGRRTTNRRGPRKNGGQAR